MKSLFFLMGILTFFFAAGFAEKEKLLLVTGCARSGTGYMTKLMWECGLDVGHERMGVHGITSWCLAVDADNVPWGDSGKGFKFRHILHQVRDPLKVIASVYKVDAIEPKSSWDFIIQHVPEINWFDKLLVKCAKYWYYWNLLAERKAEYTYRVENMENELRKIGKILGLKFDKYALDRVPKNVNSKIKHVHEFTWKDLECELDPVLFLKIKRLAKRYGYSTGN